MTLAMLLVVVTGANAAGKLTVGTRLYMHGAGLAGEIKTPADASRAAARKSAAKGGPDKVKSAPQQKLYAPKPGVNKGGVVHRVPLKK